MPQKVADLSDVTAISTGKGTTCAVAGGDAYCWGRSTDGQVGNGQTNEVLSPQKLQLSSVTEISTAEGSSCAAAGRKVYCWGSNDFGQVGDNTTAQRAEPTEVSIPN